MSEEIKDIFECLKKYANLTPDAIDDLYYLEGNIKDLQQKVEQLESIRKEAIEYIEENSQSYSLPDGIKDMRYVDFNKLLNILNKGSESNV